MAVTTTKIEVRALTCDQCGHNWTTLAKTGPKDCPRCRSREWNGKKRNGRPPSQSVALEMPKPKRMPL